MGQGQRNSGKKKLEIEFRKDNQIPDSTLENKVGIIKWEIKEQQKCKYIKIGTTWNIRRIKGKEKELILEFKKAKLQILAITETKKKRSGELYIEDHVIM